MSALTVAALFTAGRAAAPAQAAGSDDWVVVENQNEGGTGPGELIAYDPAATNWADSSAVKWTWTPTTAEGFSSAEVASDYTLPTDFKLRDTAQGQRVLVTSSEGLAAIIDYSTGNVVWKADLGADNLHAAELLPNGNMVVGSTGTTSGGSDTGTDGFIRVYASSQGKSDLDYAQYNLNDVHGVLWDPTFDRLWAIGVTTDTGAYVLDSFAITGGAAHPHITLATHQSITSGSHDLNPDPNNPNLLLVGAENYLETFNKWTGQTTVLNDLPYPVKSFTEQPSGELVSTQVDNTCANSDGWCTATVHLDTPDGSGGYTEALRTVTGKQFYRARVWNPSYNAVGDTLQGPVTDNTLSGGAWSSVSEGSNTSISQISAAALPDGTMHVETLVPGYGVYDHTRNADGSWQASTTEIDANASITAISSAVVNGTLHVQTVVPGYGVYDRAFVNGTWASSATKVDDNGLITQIAAAAVGNTLHLETLVPGSGVYDRALTPGTTETWAASTTAVPGISGMCASDPNTHLTTACTMQVSATGRADGTLHVQELVPSAGVYDLTLTGSTWSQPTLVDSNASITDIAASTLSSSPSSLDDGDTHLETVVPGHGVWDRTLAPGTSSVWAGSATKIEPTESDFTVYAAGTTDGALHVGIAAY